MKKLTIIALLIMAMAWPAAAELDRFLHGPWGATGWHVSYNPATKKTQYRHDKHGWLNPLCFGPLMEQLNGDDVTGSVIVNHPRGGGCTSANIPFPGRDEKQRVVYEFLYRIGPPLDKHDVVRVCQTVSGSMGSYCDDILIKFVREPFFEPETVIEGRPDIPDYHPVMVVNIKKTGRIKK